MGSRASAIVVALTLACGVSPLAAQLPAASAHQAQAQQQTSPSYRSPALAGALSFLVPGVGSFYAGNVRHGVRHVVLAAGGLALMAAGFSESFGHCLFQSSSCHSHGDGLIGLGLAISVVNWGWSIVTGVRDAKARDRRSAPGRSASLRLLRGVYLAPALALPARARWPSPGHSSGRAVGLRLIQLRF